MRIVIQRVSSAMVQSEGELKCEIEHGMLILLGIEHEDKKEDADWLIKKIIGLRIFNDEEGKMNLNCKDIGGQFLVISQFTLHASVKKGNRPSYIKSARPDVAIPLYQYFIDSLEKNSGTKVETGEFGADMKVALINDGPVTISIDSKNKE